MNGRWVLLDNGSGIIDRAFVPDAPCSDLALREAIIKMATNGMDTGDTLKIVDGNEGGPF